MKKLAGDVTILHMCTQSIEYSIMYGSLDMECDRQNFFVIMDRFLPFYRPRHPPCPLPPPDTLLTQKMKIEEMKKILEDIIILQMFTINYSHMIYGFSDMECNRQNYFVILDRLFALSPPTSPHPTPS